MYTLQQDQFSTYIAAHRIGFVRDIGERSSQELAVPYHLYDVELWCLVPRWATILHAIDRQPSPEVLLSIPQADNGKIRVEIRGSVRIVGTSTWAAWRANTKQTGVANDSYIIVALTPLRSMMLRQPAVPVAPRMNGMYTY